MTTFAEGKVTNDLLAESNGSFLGVSPASDTFDNFHFFLRLPLPLTPLTQLSPASPRFVPYQPYTYLESSCPLSVTVSQDAIWGTTSSSHLQRKLTIYFPSFSSPCSVVAPEFPLKTHPFPPLSSCAFMDVTHHRHLVKSTFQVPLSKSVYET